MKRTTPPAACITEEAGETVLRLGQYRLVDKLGQGGMGVVYRAEHVDTGEWVAAKTACDSSETAVSSIRREIEILDQLAHPGVIPILDHGVEGGVPWLALKLMDDSTLLDLLEETTPRFDSRVELSAPQTTGNAGLHLAAFDGLGPVHKPERPSDSQRAAFDLENARPVLEVLRRLCHTLSYLHSEGVVHGDIKPSNIQLGAGGAPVLVDFGITALFEGGRSRERIAADVSRLAGTLQYMAPEQLRGQLLDPRADMYALGCILYLGVCGQLPFGAPDPEQVVAMHLEGAYRPPSALVEGLPAELDDLIARLLATDADRRLGHADVVADTLAALLGVEAQEHTLRGAQRSHYLHRPSFVGREELLEQMLDTIWLSNTGSLDKSPQGRPGTRRGADIVLVGGLAGVGKTRLAMEFSAQARRRGMRVTVASADVGTGGVEHTGHTPPLWVFRPILRAIADHCREAGPLETARIVGRRAAVLAQYEPALAELSEGSGAPNLVDLPARAARVRIFTYLTETLIAFAAERPLLIIIDDLHLADELSLEFLAKTRHSGGLDNAVIAATFRLEHRARLAPLLMHEDAQMLRMEALGDGAVASLISDMLALPEPPEAFVEMVVEGSGGNPFVVTEYVHAAVEQGLLERGVEGNWEFEERDGGQADGGRALSVSGRLQALIEGRLERLEPPERRLVELAAVVGRRVGRELLVELSGLDANRAGDALDGLIKRSVVEVNDGAVRLVEQVGRVAYGQLAEPRRRDLHRRIARALERQPTRSQNLLHLVEQWRGAGVRARELCYVERAAERALAHGAGVTARSLLERGLELVTQIEQSSNQYGVRRARLQRLLALAHRSTGEVERAVAQLERTLAGLGSPLPQAPLQWGMRGVWELGRQLTHMLAPRHPESLTPQARARLREVLETGMALIWPLIQRGQARRAAVLSMMLANLADRLAEGQSYALPYAALGESCRHLGFDTLAESYLDRARANISDGLQRPVDYTGTIQIFLNGSVGRADWETSERLLRRAITSTEEVGDRLGLVNLSLTYAVVEVLRDRLTRAEALAMRLEKLAAQSDNSLAHAWNQLVFALIARQRGEHVRAYELIEPLDGRLDGHFHLIARAYAMSLKASSLAALGQAGAALRVGLRAAEAFEALTRGGDFNFGNYHIYQCLPQVFFECTQSSDLTDYERDRALSRARRFVGRLENLAERFPAARAASLRNRGLREAVDGQLDRASGLLSESLLEARRLRLPFEDRLTRRAAANLGSIRGSNWTYTDV